MPDIDSILVSEASRLDQEILRRSRNVTNFWLKAVPKSGWEKGRGINPRIITWEAAHVGTLTDWTTVELNDGSGSNAVTAADDLEYSKTIRTWMLQKKALQTPYVAHDDILLSHEFEDQLEAAFAAASRYTMEMWEARNRSEYVRLAGHKVIVKSAFPESPTAFPTQAATGRVTGTILRQFYRKMLDLRAHEDGGGVDMYKGQPQFIAVMSPELDDVIVRGDYQVREDFRQNNDRAPELLQAIGVDRPYQGFYHVIDSKAPRWNLVDGAWVSVPYYTTEATTEGNRPVPNPAYETATHEDTILFCPSVYTCEVPTSLPRPGGNVEFDANNYQGVWKWVNYGHNTENPDRNFGRFRGLFYSASRPRFIDHGFVLRGLRPNMVTQFIDANGDVVA